MAPEIAQLSSLAAHDEQRRPPAQRQPALSRTLKLLAQTQFTESRLQSFSHDAALAQPHFVHPVRLVLVTAIPQIEGGLLRALAVTGARRAAALPDVPTIAESGVPGYEAMQWYGMLAPAGTEKWAMVARAAHIEPQ